MTYETYLEDLRVFEKNSHVAAEDLACFPGNDGKNSQKNQISLTIGDMSPIVAPLSQTVRGREREFEGVGVRHSLNSPISEREFQLHETVFGSRFPRLSKAREFLGVLKQEDLGLLKDVFELWKNYDTYLFLKGTHRETGKKQYLLSKCSKRGNDIYARRIDTRLGFLKYGGYEKFFSGLDFNEDGSPIGEVKTRLLWVTLTFKPRLCIFEDAWKRKETEDLFYIIVNGKKRKEKRKDIQSQFNLWITNLRNKYGEINYVAFPQAFPNKDGSAFGYPHIHIILLFEDSEFNVFQTYKFDKRKKEWGFVYRIQEKNELHKQGKWSAFIDVKAIQSLSALYNYAKKHFFNAGYGDSEEAILNNAVMWFYRKKSFTMSGKFRKKLSDYVEFISSKHNSKRFQGVLDGGKPFSIIEWEFLGCFSAKRIKTVLDVGDPPFDFISLSVDEADRLLNPSLKDRLGF